MTNGYEYIIQNDGIDKESCYPYNGEDGQCHYTKSCCGAQITGYTNVQTGSETDLQVSQQKSNIM